MYPIDRESSLWAWLQDKQPVIGYYLFDFHFAGGEIATRYRTTKSGIIQLGDKLYLPFRSHVAIDPPEPTAYSIDQQIFNLSLAPRTAEEMEFEMQLWTGKIYPQAFSLQRPDLPGISATVYVAGQTEKTTRNSSNVVWYRDTAVRLVGTGNGRWGDLVRAWINLPAANPPEVSIAPEQLPNGIWTADPGTNTISPDPVYMQLLRLEGNGDLNLTFGTQFLYQDLSNPDDPHAALALWGGATGSTRGVRWLTQEAEQTYSLEIVNRRTRERRSIPFSRMQRRTTAGINYRLHRSDPLGAPIRAFIQSLPDYRDASLPENFREYGAQTCLLKTETQTQDITELLQLYQGKLHSVTKPKYADSGYRLDLGFSGPLTRIDAVNPRRLTPASQRAIDPTDKSLDSLNYVQVFGWGRENLN